MTLTVRRRIAVFLKGYPRLSETFIAQEIHNLQQSGLDMVLVSLRHPTDRKRHPIHDEITAPLLYLPEYVHDEIGRCLRGWWAARRLPGYRRARAAWFKDLRRDLTRNRVRRFVQALVAATELDDDVAHCYAHFIHTPGSVARYAALMREVPFSISAHAKDIWTSPDWELSEKLDGAEWTVTCTRGGAEHLASLAADPAKVRLLYHGLDLDRFPAPDTVKRSADGSSAERAVELLSVGRAVEKKGFDTLLEALAGLPDDFYWRWTHIAGGPLLDELRQQAGQLGLEDRVRFLGAQAQSRVLQAYRDADLFVLPCRIAADGDRDGLPNVIVEAQSQKLAVISTPISGIPELVEDGETGRLVPPNDPASLAGGILDLGRNPSLRQRMGEAGMKRVHASFNAKAEIVQLVALLERGDG